MDDVLLVDRHFLHGDFDTQVAAGNHYAVRFVKDLINVVDTLRAFDLGNDLHLAAVSIQDLADIADILRRPCKGSGNIFIAQLAAEFDVFAVLVTDEGHGQVRVRDIHALVVGDGAAVDDSAVDICIGDVFNLQLDQAVIDQDHAALGYVFDQVLVTDGSAFSCSHHFLGRKREALALFENDFPALKIAQPDLRSLCVHQRGDGFSHFLADTHQTFKFISVLLMGPV